MLSDLDERIDAVTDAPRMVGWRRLLADWPWFTGAGRYPIPAYSEFMPPPRLGRRAYGAVDPALFGDDDPFGWRVTEYEEALELAPGLAHVAQQLLDAMRHLAAGRAAHGISKAKLADNPYWPEALARSAGRLSHERFVLLLSLALTRTQDDKGRVRWTLLGASELGPARAFWGGFFAAPGVEAPAARGLDFLRRLLRAAYGVPEVELRDLRGAGFRFLPIASDAADRGVREGPLPAWTRPLQLDASEPLDRIRFLLSFRPFAELPPPVQRAYLAGELHLLPFPGSLLFWGAQPYQKLAQQLPCAQQIPLLHGVGRHEGPFGLRVPQSGWLHEATPEQPALHPSHGPLRDRFKRTHRWARVLRHDDELALTDREDLLTHVLFSALPDDVRLYGKPMARNAQLWSTDFQCLLDGPCATHADIESALHAVRRGGSFGYRFQYPAMCVGRHAVHWHRPLVALVEPSSGRASLLADTPLGVLTACEDADPARGRTVELWPRLLQREPHLAAIALPAAERVNVQKLLDAHALLGAAPLPRSFARALLTAPKHRTLDDWLAALAAACPPPSRLVGELQARLAVEPEPPPAALTYARSARRSFEVAYWKTIASLAEGRYRTKNNADCVLDGVTQARLDHRRRDLAALGDHLLGHYRSAIAAAGMAGRALVGELPFRWQTDFDFPWMEGWLENRRGEAAERNLIAVIPGRDRSRAVILADHYDTAYMEDCYEESQGGDGARLAAAGADDNHSATAALMLGAPIFLELARAGALACDVWLVHLTGEEFPADCLGARHLCQALVEGRLELRLADGGSHDLSKARVAGVYVLDMIAHNNDRSRDVFQIAPGACAESMRLAQQAHRATEAWSASTRAWNRRSSRRGASHGRRSASAAQVPAIARHLALHAEVRPPCDPHSTLYNTDGQIFSDAGVPVVLFMENYDINRSGYHDTHDTMANIDLDYGAALAAIAIESVARVAMESAMLAP
jgi:hypothetical protein